ncbi:MAG: 4-amino-4-deoxy-L-arabinose transferase-like glycosyltransferase [Hyphomicrobiaceae bacterium]|jgi:4-amino-4-deoxy-L-arabinose transferase-like glycosyltransferase
MSPLTTPAIIVFSLAFLLRAGWSLFFGVDPSHNPVLDDMLWYHTTAVGLSQGSGYIHPFSGQPTAAWPPGYPAILAAIYSVFGIKVGFAHLANALLGTASCVLVWRLTAATFTERTGLIAAALLAFLPSHIFFCGLLLTETAFTTGFVAVLALACALLRRDVGASNLQWFLWGIVVGALTLVRAESVLIVAAVFLALLASRARLRAVATTTGTTAIAIAIGVSIALAPWVYRNALVFDAFVPTSTAMGRTALIGHHALADGSMTSTWSDLLKDNTPLSTPAEELASDKAKRAQALEFAINNPGAELGLIGKRLYWLFRGDHMWISWYDAQETRLALSTTTKKWLGRLSNGYYLAVAVAALIGFLTSLRLGRADLRLVQATVVVWPLFFATLFYGAARFHFALMPVFCIFAAHAISALPFFNDSPRH